MTEEPTDPTGATDQIARQRAAMFDTVSHYEADRVRLVSERERERQRSASRVFEAEETLRVESRDLRARLEAESAAVRGLESELARTYSELNRIRSSRSWRVTKPLRRSADLLRRLRGLS